VSEYFHEDEILGRAFDARLMRRLIRFLKDYKALFAVTVVLTMVIAGIQLVLPFLTKIAIDNYMSLSYAVVELDEQPSYGSPVSLGENRYLLEVLDVPPEIRRDWEADGTLSDERFLFLDEGDADASLGTEYAEVLEPVACGFIATQESLSNLPAADLERIRGGAIAGILRLASLFAFALLARFLFGVAQVYLLQYTGQRVMFDMRREIFGHILRLPLRFFDRTPVGRLVTRATNDVAAINEMFTSMLVNLFRDAFIVVGILVVMFQFEWRLALVISALFPVIVFAAWKFRDRVRVAYREVRKQIARLNAYLQESISGMRIIQVFTQEKKANARFEEINELKYRADMKRLLTFAIFRPLMSFLSSFAVALVIWYGGLNVLRGSLSLGALTAFIQYVRMLFEPVLHLSEGYNVLQGAMASSERIFRLLDEPEEDRGRGQTVKELTGRIEFRDVWFAYNEED